MTVSKFFDEWRALRAELAALARAEHPDITDRFGRVWAWKSKDLYRHCGNAAPADMIEEFGLPTQSALDNQNYDLCGICINGRQRNIRPCKAEWGCSHKACQGTQPRSSVIL